MGALTWDQMGGMSINDLPPYREMEERAARALYPEWAKTAGKEQVETRRRSKVR